MLVSNKPDFRRKIDAATDGVFLDTFCVVSVATIGFVYTALPLLSTTRVKCPFFNVFFKW